MFYNTYRNKGYKMTDFEKMLKAMRVQYAHEERKYRNTGLKTELMLRMEAIAKAHK
jgi:hypothetical protein